MFLEKIDVEGFRGISHLSVMLDDSTLLIGENAWGKSSLLDALSLVLSVEQPKYQLVKDDFHRPFNKANDIQYLSIRLTFCEAYPGYSQTDRYRKLSPVWIKGRDNLYRIYYEVVGMLCPDGRIEVLRHFLNYYSKPLQLHSTEALVEEIVRLHPVLRLNRYDFVDSVKVKSQETENKLAKQMAVFCKKLAKDDPTLESDKIENGLRVMRSILEHYFSRQKMVTIREPNYRYSPSKMDWRSLENLNKQFKQVQNRRVRALLLGIFATILQARGQKIFDMEAQPILLLEEPENQFHPIMLAVSWGLVDNIPLQKIVTTNSSELVSFVPIERVCRLIKRKNRVEAYRLGNRPLSTEDNRRISFHIRFNRASAMFSRCWLLVEGETEVWMLSEFARLCGHHFDAEGIRIIEFAQCGIKPLVKYADRMGIKWHVLVDGDDAGKRYAATVRSLIGNKNRDNEHNFLTVLPAVDLENYIYKEGFQNVYHDVAMVTEETRMNPRRVIHKALQRTSKPDMAIVVAEEANRRGAKSVPPLLEKMFYRVVRLARKNEE